jgi:hypothetical protein
MARVRFLSRRRWCGLGIVLLLVSPAGCAGSKSGTTDPQAKLRLEKLLMLYQLYITEKHKPPAGEQELHQFLQSLPEERKHAYQVPDDVTALFTSPRDGQKYVVRYSFPLTTVGDNQAFAWEQTGQDGKRYVALSSGYVEAFGEEDFQNLKKK